MKAVGFFYTWNGRRTLDPYFGQVAAAFAELGIALKIVLANELIHPNGGQETVNPFVDPRKVVSFVDAERPDFIFSVNNAGMSEQLERGTQAPIVKWLVDDEPHLFFHDGRPAADRGFSGRERVVCYASTLAAQIEAAFPASRGKVSWVSHGTNLAGWKSDRVDPAYPISFVGSCLNYQAFSALLRAAGKRGAAPELLAALAAMRVDYVAAVADPHASTELRAAIAEARLTWLDYKRALSDVLSTQLRVEGLARVADLGLHLFGNELWLDTIVGTAAIAEAYQYTNPVDSYDKLLDTYARSRIAINIPNVQNCAGLAARVFDAMASPSLLITEYREDSDLFALFGADCPVPMYRDFDHLRELCEFYLADEDERLHVVAACNRLIDDRFLLRNRLAAILEEAGIVVPTGLHPAPAPAIMPAAMFPGLPTSLDAVGPWSRLAVKQALLRTAGPVLRAVRGSRIMR